MNKFIIVGCPGSGKSTLANKIAGKYEVAVLHLDKIFWIKPGGIKQEEFLEKQIEFMSGNDGWVVDGDFVRSSSFEERIKRADKIYVYDLPKSLVVWRFMKRSLRAFGKSRSDMPGDRIETFSAITSTLKYISEYSNELILQKISDAGVNNKMIKISSLRKEKEKEITK